MDFPPHYWWGRRKMGMPAAHLPMPVAHLSKLIILPAAAGNTTGGCIVLVHNYPLSPKLTLSKRSRFCCSWSLIAICPGCPKLLWRTLRRVYCPLNSSKYRPQAKTAWHGRPGLPALDLPIAPNQDRSPANCAMANLQAAHCTAAT